MLTNSKKFGVSDIEENFNKYLSQLNSEQYPNIVDNLEKNGYRSKHPDFQEIELEVVLEQQKLRNDTLMGLRQFQSVIDYSLNMASTELMEMSVEDVLTMVEKARNTKIDTFSELLAHMAVISSSEVEAVSGNRLMYDEDEDMLVDDPTSVAALMISPPPLKTKKFPAINEIGKNAGLFPSPASMMKNKNHQKFMTPTPSNLFQFGAVPPSTNKAPRHLKPNEVVFSQSGSPLIVPKLHTASNAMSGNTEQITVKDNDGKKIVDVVLIQGDDENVKEFKTYVNSIKSLVTLQSTAKKTRILEPRLARRPPKGGQTSASKKSKPNWH